MEYSLFDRSAVIAILVAVSFVSRERTVALVMRNAAHLAVMVWLWRELHAIPLEPLEWVATGM